MNKERSTKIVNVLFKGVTILMVKELKCINYFETFFSTTEHSLRVDKLYIKNLQGKIHQCCQCHNTWGRSFCYGALPN